MEVVKPIHQYGDTMNVKLINMCTKNCLLMLLILNISCSSHIKTEPIEIVITSDISYKYDLFNGLYTVFYNNKPPTVISFHLTDIEKKKIINKYYYLKLYELNKIDNRTGNIYIKDKCMTMPKDRTILEVQTKGKKQEIQIDLYCNSFYWSNFIEANRVKKFINFVLSMVNSKPEIKNAPSSDIMYM
jgi:hypothetical protein